MKSVLKSFYWSAPLVSRGNWSDRKTESESGPGLKTNVNEAGQTARQNFNEDFAQDFIVPAISGTRDCENQTELAAVTNVSQRKKNF